MPNYFLYCDALCWVELQASGNQIEALRVDVREELFLVGLFRP